MITLNASQSPLENVHLSVSEEKFMVQINRITSDLRLSWPTGIPQMEKIIEEVGSGELRPGVIQYFLQHNLIVDNKSRVHLFAKVLWLASLPNMNRYHCGKPVELWRQNVFDTFGPSAFIPVQRISCKYICADGMLLNECVSYICPVIKGVNV